MPRLVTATCPRCGAALELRPGVDVVTCHFCGYRSVIEWEGARHRAAPTPPPIDPELGRIVAQVPRAAANALLTFVIVGAVVPAVAGAAIFLALNRAQPPAVPEVPPIPTIPSIPGAPPVVPTVTPAPPLGARMVDASELVAKARTMALAQTRDPVLSSAVFFDVVGGLVDTSLDNAGSISFDFASTNANAPPGKDVSYAKLSVHVARGNMSGTTMPWGAPDRDRKLDVPACSSLAAWNVAVQSGVPQNAVATLHLYFNGAFSPKSPTVWSVRVEGHDEHRREIDARTCQMVKNWGAPAGGPRKR
jgi:hypothetical protein